MLHIKIKDNYTPADDAYAVGHVKLALYIRSKLKIESKIKRSF